MLPSVTVIFSLGLTVVIAFFFSLSYNPWSTGTELLLSVQTSHVFYLLRVLRNVSSVPKRLITRRCIFPLKTQNFGKV